MTTPLKSGDRIRLISMTDDPDPIPAGTTGTVAGVYPQNGWAQIDVDWDNGRSLMLSIPPDMVERIETRKMLQAVNPSTFYCRPARRSRSKRRMNLGRG